MMNPGFNPVEFIIEVGMENYTQVAWKVREEGRIFIVALGESNMGIRIESKSQALTFVSPNFVLVVLISDFNKVNSFTYNLSRSSPFECFVSNSDGMKKQFQKT